MTKLGENIFFIVQWNFMITTSWGLGYFGRYWWASLLMGYNYDSFSFFLKISSEFIFFFNILDAICLFFYSWTPLRRISKYRQYQSFIGGLLLLSTYDIQKSFFIGHQNVLHYWQNFLTSRSGIAKCNCTDYSRNPPIINKNH